LNLTDNMNSSNRARRPKAKAQNRRVPHPDMLLLNDTLKTLILSTQNKSIPALRDVQPLEKKRAAVHTFQVKVDKGNVTATALGTGGAFFFTINDTPAPTDFLSLFDQYRIAQVQVEFLPSVAPFTASTTATDLPVLITAIDYDDATTPTATVLQQFESAQIVSDQSYHCRTLNPRFAVSAYGGVFGSFALAPQRSWIDSASNVVQYYGLKWATTPLTTPSAQILYRVMCTYTIQCRNNN